MPTDLSPLVDVLQIQNRLLSELLTAIKAQEGALAADYTRVTGAGTTVVRNSAGYIAGVNLNNLGTVAASATIYDAAGTASIGTAQVVAAPVWGTSAASPAYLPLGPGGDGLAVNNGLVVVTTGSADITIASRAL